MHPNPIKFEPGQRFGRLVVIAKDGTTIEGSHWLCQCDCGTTRAFSGSSLKRGIVRSCGCLRREVARTTFTTHGQSESAEFKIWMGILQRCTNPRNKAYPNYGKRGITVCERWQFFENFYADMGARPSPDHSVDRVNNDGPYAPANCRWATHGEQRRNSRKVVRVTYHGKTMVLRDWAAELGFTYTTLKHRFQRGWSIERAFTTPSRGA
jgi:hypothetical protein